MSKSLLLNETEEIGVSCGSGDVTTMNVPSAPPAYDDEFKPPASYPPPYTSAPPYNPQFVDGAMQQAPASAVGAPLLPNNVVSTQSPYPQQMYAQGTPPVVQPYQPQAVAAQPVTAVISQTERVFLGHLPVGPQPLRTQCPHCQAQIKTATKTNTHCSAHLTCLLLCFLACWCCSCLPYCMDSFHSVVHHCPNCKAYLGTYQKH